MESKAIKKRNELVKLRSIYSVDIIHYLISDFFISPFEK